MVSILKIDFMKYTERDSEQWLRRTLGNDQELIQSNLGLFPG